MRTTVNTETAPANASAPGSEGAPSAATALTPLEERAIRRFDHDRTFHLRCHTAAGVLRMTQPGADRSECLQGGSGALLAAGETEKDGV